MHGKRRVTMYCKILSFLGLLIICLIILSLLAILPLLPLFSMHLFGTILLILILLIEIIHLTPLILAVLAISVHYVLFVFMNSFTVLLIMKNNPFLHSPRRDLTYKFDPQKENLSRQHRQSRQTWSSPRSLQPLLYWSPGWSVLSHLCLQKLK